MEHNDPASFLKAHPGFFPPNHTWPTASNIPPNSHSFNIRSGQHFSVFVVPHDQHDCNICNHPSLILTGKAQAHHLLDTYSGKILLKRPRSSAG